MKKLLKKNQKIYIIPEDIKGAFSTKIIKSAKNILEIQITADDIAFYNPDDNIEAFSVVNEGVLYFKPRVAEVDKKENVLKIEFDEKNCNLLQRREYTRIDIEKEFTLKDGETEYVCTMMDLSAGGLKILTNAPLTTEKDYEIEFSLESNIPIQCFFKPIRVAEVKGKNKPAKNIVSGRFIALKNIDKIAIVQFCFKKQMENKNK